MGRVFNESSRAIIAIGAFALFGAACSEGSSPTTVSSNPSTTAPTSTVPSVTEVPFPSVERDAPEPWSRPDIDTEVDGAVVVEPGMSLGGTVGEHPPGTTFVIASGVHVGQSVTPRTGDVFLGEEGAILDGDFLVPYAISAHDIENPVEDVVIKGIVFENYDTPVQLGTLGGGGGHRWLIEGNEIRGSRGGAIEIGSGSVVRNNFVHHNEQIGLHIGSPASDVLVEGNEVSFNNFDDQYDMAWEAGGAKFVFTTDLVVRDNYVHDNRGAGLWTDGDNIGTVYEGNYVVDNAGPGIFHEISYEARIVDNYVEGNAFDFYFGGILVANSSNVTVTGNIVVGNDGGVIALQDDRGEGAFGPYDVTGLVVEDNVVEGGPTGLRLNTESFDPSNAGLVFDRNVYAASAGDAAWLWADGDLDFDGWLNLGFDRAGVIAPDSTEE